MSNHLGLGQDHDWAAMPKTDMDGGPFRCGCECCAGECDACWDEHVADLQATDAAVDMAVHRLQEAGLEPSVADATHIARCHFYLEPATVTCLVDSFGYTAEDAERVLQLLEGAEWRGCRVRDL